MGSHSSKPKPTPQEKRARAGIGHTSRNVTKKPNAARQTVPPKINENGVPPKINENGHLTPEEVVKRTTSSIHALDLVLGNSKESGNLIQMKYGYLTQRGYYPDDLHKANQDAYSITRTFAGEDGDSLLAVFDGHGKDGHDCAQYAKKKLPQLLTKYIRRNRSNAYRQTLTDQGKSLKGAYNPAMWPMLSETQYEDACKKAYVECNELMHADKTIPDRLSGTTSISACFHYGRLTVCNLGDSRVVLGHRVSDKDNGNDNTNNGKTSGKGGPPVGHEEEKREEGEESYQETPEAAAPAFKSRGGELVAIPLSRDQTPYRKDERERVKKEGAVVQSVDQMQGDEPMHENWGDMVLGEDIDVQGDPPRVWKKDRDYPGTAFTRAIGDSVADDLGVFAEPEMLTAELSRDDEILVIASDGIFEFMTNQAVIEICAECNNPLEACEQVAKASYDQWLNYEDRTDDITIIVCFLQCGKISSGKIEGTTRELLNLARDTSGLKPIRTTRKNSAK